MSSSSCLSLPHPISRAPRPLPLGLPQRTCRPATPEHGACWLPVPQLQWPRLPPSQPGWPCGFRAEREAGHGQLGPGRTGPSSGENPSVCLSICPGPDGWVGTALGRAADPGSSLQIDEVASPEPEPANTSDFSDWSSFNGKRRPTLPLGAPRLPAPLTALLLGIASGAPEREEVTSASAAPAFYSQAPRPPASPSRPEQHTVIHMGGPEPLTHGEPGRRPARRTERERDGS